jgi:hypothetical protein
MGFDDHTAAHAGILGQVGTGYQFIVPFGIVAAAGSQFGHDVICWEREGKFESAKARKRESLRRDCCAGEPSARTFGESAARKKLQWAC